MTEYVHCQFCHTVTNRSTPERCDSIEAALKCGWLSNDMRRLLLARDALPTAKATGGQK